MAMNLRLDEEDRALLRALADAEHVSLHEAALRAIRRSAREVAHAGRVGEATGEMIGRWGDVLDRLGRA
ncbi:MAG TPA: toxin-antitoxin system protein [Streptosporangiaceae bacterium]